MDIYDHCEFMPKFVIDDNKNILLPCPDEFIADKITPDSNSFYVETVDGVDYYSMSFLINNGWFSGAMIDSFCDWLKENDIDTSVVGDKIKIKWITRDGDEPEGSRSIGFSTEGEVYVPIGMLNIKGGSKLGSLFYLDTQFVSVHDWYMTHKEEVGDLPIAELVKALAKIHGLECKPFE